MVEVNQRLLYFNGGYDKKSQDGTFTIVTAVTPTGRFRITADFGTNLYHPDSMKRIQSKDARKYSGGSTPYCRLINEDNKKLEERALKRLWIDRLSAINFETLTSDQLQAFVGTANTHGVK